MTHPTSFVFELGDRALAGNAHRIRKMLAPDDVDKTGRSGERIKDRLP